MDDDQFDSALIGMAMTQAEALGWHRVTVAGAAREAGLPLDQARARFPVRASILSKLGLLADQAALVDEGSTGTTRERLFDVLMRRFDVFQQYRGGVRMVLRALPADPGLALMLTGATQTSMAWMAQAAGLDTSGVAGMLRVGGLVAVWLQTLRAWDRDDSPDLSATMVALDRALDRAESAGRFLGGSFASDAPPEPDVGPPGEPFTPEPLPPASGAGI